MQRKTSIKNTDIIFDETSRNCSLTEILTKRFEGVSILEKTLDDLYDPYLMKDMDRAVERIHRAKEHDEKVVVFWDYDVDGVTSTSLLVHLFSKLGMKVSYRLPHRVHDGYGLKKYFVDELAGLGVTLIVTVDCGSRDREIVTYAKELWVDIIVTDHHHVPEDMPDDAQAFLNPNRPDCSYPDKCLSGAGVAYKLVMAVAKKYFSYQEYLKYIEESIDIAAIWTVADCMLLTGENRIIVTLWLRQLKKSRSNGIRQMIEDKINDDLDADIFWFLIGPRLNAAGRMDTPYKAVNLILNNSETVHDTLRDIENLNTLRKSKTLYHTESALENINPEDNIIFYHSSDIEHGIIGIVAGRLTEKYFKPSIVLIDEWEKYVASCRSPDYFSLIEILDTYQEMFIAYGWHRNAAGFSISKEKFPEFQKKILADVNAQDFSEYKKELVIDKCVRLDEIWFRLLEEQNVFKPFWMGNTKPLYLIEDFSPEKIAFLWKWREHLKFENRYGFKIFGFSLWEYYEILRKNWALGLVVDIAEDNFWGQRGIMLKVIDIIV